MKKKIKIKVRTTTITEQEAVVEVEDFNRDRMLNDYKQYLPKDLKPKFIEESQELFSMELVPETDKETKTDVHTEHCCLTCGCKYGDKKCSVTTLKRKQSYSHETCESAVMCGGV